MVKAKTRIHHHPITLEAIIHSKISDTTQRRGSLFRATIFDKEDLRDDLRGLSQSKQKQRDLERLLLKADERNISEYATKLAAPVSSLYNLVLNRYTADPLNMFSKINKVRSR